MSEKRRDNKNRILHTGEVQLSNGRYRFKYVDLLGNEKYVYSWRLESRDPVKKGTRRDLSLREKEKLIQKDLMDGISTIGKNITVLDLVQKYIKTKIGVRPNTRASYGTVVNLLKREPFGAKKIGTLTISDAKCWLIKLQQEDGKSYSAIASIRGVLRPAFEQAFEDDLVRKNIFNFQLVDVLVNDSVRRDSISREQEKKFLNFVKNDKHFRNYYEGFFILFNTGMRISEFCGLCVADIDFRNHTININKQLQKRGSKGYYILPTKTDAGTRVIPMTADVEKCFKRMIKKRPKFEFEPTVDGVSGFLSFDKNGSIEYSLHWNRHMHYAVEKYNRIYKKELPNITPHVCRHTYCSKMANSGMNPKILQYLMGHSDITVTFNTYSHTKISDAENELKRLDDIKVQN